MKERSLERPKVAPRRPRSRPRVSQRSPNGSSRGPKWAENSSKTSTEGKSVRTSKMTTLPPENHICEGLKPKIDPTASQTRFEAYKNSRVVTSAYKKLKKRGSAKNLPTSRQQPWRRLSEPSPLGGGGISIFEI